MGVYSLPVELTGRPFQQTLIFLCATPKVSSPTCLKKDDEVNGTLPLHPTQTFKTIFEFEKWIFQSNHITTNCKPLALALGSLTPWELPTVPCQKHY